MLYVFVFITFVLLFWVCFDVFKYLNQHFENKKEGLCFLCGDDRCDLISPIFFSNDEKICKSCCRNESNIYQSNTSFVKIFKKFPYIFFMQFLLFIFLMIGAVYGNNIIFFLITHLQLILSLIVLNKKKIYLKYAK